jgi:hypothetical protein
VAEIDGNRKSRPARVLRAEDVIPPFDKDSVPVNEPDGGLEGPTLAQARKEQPKRERKSSRPAETGSDSAGMSVMEQAPTAPEIPAFDLAEHILAEHRRTATQRRKAPGQAQTEPEATPERAAVRTHVIELPSPPSQDQLELHQVVAEIVARDIDRLCRQPSRSPSG